MSRLDTASNRVGKFLRVSHEGQRGADFDLVFGSRSRSNHDRNIPNAHAQRGRSGGHSELAVGNDAIALAWLRGSNGNRP